MFDTYINDMNTWMETVKVNLYELYDDADKVNKLFNSLEGESKYNKISNRILVNIATVVSEFDTKLETVSSIRNALVAEAEMLRNKLEEVEKYNTELETRLKDIKIFDNSKIASNVVMLADSINTLGGLLDIAVRDIDTNNSNRIGDVVGRLNKAVELIENNVGVLSVAEYRKSDSNKLKDRSGVNSPRYKINLDTQELINDYTSNNNHITKDMKIYYKEKYDITYNGLMERLKAAGVWQGRKK